MKKRAKFINSLLDKVNVLPIEKISLITIAGEYVTTGRKCFLEKFYEEIKPYETK